MQSVWTLFELKSIQNCKYCPNENTGLPTKYENLFYQFQVVIKVSSFVGNPVNTYFDKNVTKCFDQIILKSIPFLHKTTLFKLHAVCCAKLLNSILAYLQIYRKKNRANFLKLGL